MKLKSFNRLLMLLAAFLTMSINLWATDVTFDPTTDKTFPKEGVTISVGSGTLTNGTDYRVYKNNTMTISSTVGNITNIALTYSDASNDGGGWSTAYTPNATTWTSPTASGEQARITKIVVTIASGGGGAGNEGGDGDCPDASVYMDFGAHTNFSSWTTTYGEHVLNYTEANVTFANANKPSSGSSVEGMPITKSDPVYIVANGSNKMTSVHLVFKKWGTYSKTITLQYSTNGGTTYSDFSPAVSTTDFDINVSSLPAGTNALKIIPYNSGTARQVGVESACIAFGTSYTASIASGIENGSVKLNSDTKSISGDAGTTITLSAIAADDYEFSAWVVKKKSDNTDVTASVVSENTLTLPEYDVIVSAIFVQTYAISIVSSNTTMGDAAFDDAEDSKDLTKGAEEIITAMAETGYEFVNWTVSPEGAVSFGNANSESTTLTVSNTITGAATVTANFRLIPAVTYDAYIDVNHSTYGTATINGDNTRVSVAENDEMTVVAVANDGYRFKNWTAEPAVTFADAEATTTTFSMPAEEVTVTANFEAIPTFVVKWSVNGDDAYASETVRENNKVSALPTTPTSCYASIKFMGWTNAPLTTKQADAPAVLFNSVDDVPVVTEAVTYYAVWATGESGEKTVTWNINGVGTATTSTNKIVNTSLSTSSVSPSTETGVWTAVTTTDSYAATSSGKAQLGSGSNPFNGTITLSGSAIPAAATIKQINLTATSSATDANPYSISATVGGAAFDDAQTISSGSANCEWKPATGVVGNSIVLTTSCGYNKNIVISALLVKYDYSETKDYTTICTAPVEVHNPVLTTAAGSYYKSQSFAISQDQQGMMVKYTTDGSDPRTSATALTYSSALTLTAGEATTIKAIATDGNDNWSEPVMATYTIYPHYTTAEAVRAAMTTIDTKASVEVENMLVTAVKGNNFFAIDAANKGFNFNTASHGFAVGDKFSGVVEGSILVTSNGAYQIKDAAKANLTTTSDNTITPLTSIAGLDGTNTGVIVSLEGWTATIDGSTTTLAKGAESITYYDFFGVKTLTSGSVYDITGMVYRYKSGEADEILEIAPRAAADVVWKDVKLAAPANLVAENEGTTTVDLSWDAVENASSYMLTYATAANPSATTDVAGITEASYNLTGLTSNTEYVWSVTAIGDQITYSNSEAAVSTNFSTLDPAGITHAIVYHVTNGNVVAGAPEEVTDGLTFIYPEVENVTCSGGYTFAGWTTQSTFADAETAPADMAVAGATSAFVVTDVHLYAVYTKTTEKTTDFATFAATDAMTEAEFVIAAHVGTDYIALPNSDYPVQNSAAVQNGKEFDITEKTNLQDNKITISKASTSGYNLSYKVNGAKRYVVGKADKTGLGYVTSAPATGWTLGTAVCGSYRLISTVTNSRGLYATSSAFGHYSTSNVTASQTTYYDLEIIPVPQTTASFSINPDCRPERALTLASSEGAEVRLVETVDGETITTTITAVEGTGSNGELTLSFAADYGTKASLNNADKTVTFTEAGTYLVKANQAATAEFLATEATITLTVLKPYNTLTYDANGGTDAPSEQTDIKGEKVVVAAAGVMTKGTDAFSKWNTAADGSGTNYLPGANYTLNGSATLYAIWEPSVEVIVDADLENGTIVPDKQYALAGSTITLTITPNAGYALVPGSVKVTKASDGTEVSYSESAGTFTMPNENVNVTAEFAVGALYTVKWVAAAGGVAAHAELVGTGAVPVGTSGEYAHSAGSRTASNFDQVTNGNTMTLTIKGYEGKIITGLHLNMHSNASAGKGTFSAKVGSKDAFAAITDATDFNAWFDNTAFGTACRWVNVTMPNNYVYVGESEDLVIEIACVTNNSLYCESVFIEWADGHRRTVSQFSAGTISTICLPKAVEEGEFTGCTVYEIAYKTLDANGDPYKIFFDEVFSMKAGVPYVIELEEGASEALFMMSGDAVAEPDNSESKGLTGTFTAIDDLLNGNSVLMGNYMVYQNMIKKCGTGCLVGANKAYIQMNHVPGEEPILAPGRRRISLGNPAAVPGMTTDVENVENAAEQVEKHLINGVIYVIRGGKMYDLNGRLAK